MQHMAFDEYADTATASQRREVGEDPGPLRGHPLRRQSPADPIAHRGRVRTADSSSQRRSGWASRQRQALRSTRPHRLGGEPALARALLAASPARLAVAPRAVRALRTERAHAVLVPRRTRTAERRQRSSLRRVGAEANFRGSASIGSTTTSSSRLRRWSESPPPHLAGSRSTPGSVMPTA